MARDLYRDVRRTFRADRITPRTPTGPRFTPREPPGGDVSGFVARRFRGSTGPDTRQCRDEVILDLPAAEMSPYVHDGVAEARTAAGSCWCSWSWPGPAASRGRFDAGIEVVGPAGLRLAFARPARRYAAAATPTT